MNFIVGVLMIVVGCFDDYFGLKWIIFVLIGLMIVVGFVVFFFWDGGLLVFWIGGFILCVFVGLV